ncbi:patatin-like phospholipase family protein [Acidobacteriota bacterium]
MGKTVQKAALVLSGGGALGTAHLGAIQSFERAGIAFDFYAGVSAGAIVCAALACGKTADEIMNDVKETNLLKLAFDLTRSSFGIVRGESVKKILDDAFEGKRFEDLDVPLYIGATDFSSGERVNISKGKLSDAVRASVSVPILFEPFYHESEGRWLIDGGVVQNFPIDTAMEKYKGKKIIGVDIAGSFQKDMNFDKKKFFGKSKDLAAVGQRIVRIMFKSQQEHFPPDDRVLIIRPSLDDFTALDILKLEAIAERGREAALQALENSSD